MAWTDLTSFDSGSKLTSDQMAEVASNFGAMAAGQAGAPPLAVNSFIASGVSSLGSVAVASGMLLAAAPATPVANEAYQQSIAKAYVLFQGSDSGGAVDILGSYNVASVTDAAAGNYTVNWETDFADALYSVGVSASDHIATGQAIVTRITTRAVGSVGALNHQGAGNTLVDVLATSVIAFGDQ